MSGFKISLPPGTLSQFQGRTTSNSQSQSSSLNESSRLQMIPINSGFGIIDENEEVNNYSDEQEEEERKGEEKEDDQWGNSENISDLENDDAQTQQIEQDKSDEIDEEDRVIMPFVPSDYSYSSNDDENLDDEGDDDSNLDKNSVQSDEYGLDDISLSPPESMPLLAVELNKLCGYTPSDEKEAKRLIDELCNALLGAKIDDGNKDEDATEKEQTSANDKEDKNDDGLSLNFTSRAVELMETGVAHHMDTLQQELLVGEDDDETKLNYAFVPYPEFLLLPSHNNQDGEPSIMATTKIWKRILHSHDIPVVQKLLQLLSKCSRDLMWKHELSMEIRRIAKEEKRWQEERAYRKELKVWRKEKRPAELAKLYDVRETFELKLEMLRKKHDGYIKEREDRVERELLRRKEMGIGSGGMSGLDWDGAVTFAFEDDKDDEDHNAQKSIFNRNGIQEDSSSIESGYHESGGENFERKHDDGYDCDDCDVSDEDKSDLIPDQTQVITNDSTCERKSRRAKAASKRLRRKLEAEREKARAANLLSKVKAAHEEEDHVRQMCISTDEKLAMVMVTNMEKRMERIDDLLDSLQMDAWKDEEEGLLESGSSDNEDDNELANDDDMTLLDNILAMILGALPPPKSISTQEHFNFLKEEHKSIVDEWKIIFGRLPKLATKDSTDKNVEPKAIVSNDIWSDNDDNSTQKETIKRKTFNMNLVKSIPDDWENEVDCDDFIFPAFETKNQSKNIHDKKKSLVQNSTTKDYLTVNKGKIGLRPGGGILN